MRFAHWKINTTCAQTHACACVRVSTLTRTQAHTRARERTHAHKFVILSAFPRQQYFLNAPQCYVISTRWFKYDRDKLWRVYTQSVPVIFEPPCIFNSKGTVAVWFLTDCNGFANRFYDNLALFTSESNKPSVQFSTTKSKLTDGGS